MPNNYISHNPTLIEHAKREPRGDKTQRLVRQFIIFDEHFAISNISDSTIFGKVASSRVATLGAIRVADIYKQFTVRH